jgi:hypothetical protein
VQGRSILTAAFVGAAVLFVAIVLAAVVAFGGWLWLVSLR